MAAPGWPILWFQPHWSAMSPACNAQKVLMGLLKPVSIGSDSCCSCSDTCITTHACSASISTMQKRKDGAASQLCLEVHQVCPALLGLVSLTRSGALQGRDRDRGRRRGWGRGAEGSYQLPGAAFLNKQQISQCCEDLVSSELARGREFSHYLKGLLTGSLRSVTSFSQSWYTIASR